MPKITTWGGVSHPEDLAAVSALPGTGIPAAAADAPEPVAAQPQAAPESAPAASPEPAAAPKKAAPSLSKAKTDG